MEEEADLDELKEKNKTKKEMAKPKGKKVSGISFFQLRTLLLHQTPKSNRRWFTSKTWRLLTPWTSLELCMFVHSFLISLVRSVSFDFEESSFRKVFEAFGAIQTVFMVRSPRGRLQGYG